MIKLHARQISATRYSEADGTKLIAKRALG